MGKPQWVVKTNNGRWGVRGENNTKTTSVHSTQEKAIIAARKIAINQKTELIIQDRNGKIREKNSYGNDPHPPKG